ncbi:copper resistance protein NlpE N-terminal domain-containing protein [Acinetobacter rudis]|uniref:copper resistance protein NlpE N-terminal domain-containing protein n=1 Tax=Acinetobacter rudis TaxID=632955 RepID=UPI00333FEFD4
MKNKPLLTSLLCVSLNVACSKSESEQTQTVQSQQNNDALATQKASLRPELQPWVGHYQADIPCKTCITRCEGCEGTHVDLKLYADQSYRLVRERNAQDEPAEHLAGRFVFLDAAQDKIQLVGTSQRGLIVRAGDFTEIYNQDTGLAYDSSDEFILEKS